jgi:hypothetical protein
VGFGATLKAGGVGVFTARDGKMTEVIAPSGRYTSIRNALLNQGGLVCFAATPRDGALGIFCGPDPVSDRILGFGDALFGSSVTEFALNPVSVNDAGQIAIRIKLADHRQVIARADPKQNHRRIQ